MTHQLPPLPECWSTFDFGEGQGITSLFTVEQMNSYAQAAVEQALREPPEGWKLIPAEPTQEQIERMTFAVIRTFYSGPIGLDDLDESDSVKSEVAYAAAIAAAPKYGEGK